jgi:hypothetical protein
MRRPRMWTSRCNGVWQDIVMKSEAIERRLFFPRIRLDAYVDRRVLPIYVRADKIITVQSCVDVPI